MRPTRRVSSCKPSAPVLSRSLRTTGTSPRRVKAGSGQHYAVTSLRPRRTRSEHLPPRFHRLQAARSTLSNGEADRETLWIRPLDARAPIAKRGTRFEAEPIRQGVRSARLARASPAGCVFGTTTGRTIWLTTFNRRWRSSASRARRVSCGSPKATASTLHPHAEGEFVVGAEFRHHRGAPPGLTRV